MKSPLRLLKRTEFLAVRNGEKRRGPFFLLEVKMRTKIEPSPSKISNLPRVGFTVTKKSGNAVIRNRIRRRLREAVRIYAADKMLEATDYVIVARRDALHAPFTELSQELTRRVSQKAQ